MYFFLIMPCLWRLSFSSGLPELRKGCWCKTPVEPACVITQCTGLAVITAELWSTLCGPKNHPPLPLSVPPLAHRSLLQAAIGSRRQPLPSHWSSRSCCLVTSEACIFEQSSGCLLQHFLQSAPSHTHTHTRTRWQNTPTPYLRTSHNARRRHPGSAARPAGDDSDTSKCSTGITFRQPDDPILTETTSERLRVQPGAGWSAGFFSHRRRVKRLTSQKKNRKKKKCAGFG